MEGTIDQLIEVLAEVGGIEGFNAAMAEVNEIAGRETDELWALTEGAERGSDDLTEAESLIIWDDKLSHRQKVTKLRLLKRARGRRRSGVDCSVVPIS
jgi:hypothetical protein